MAVFTFESKNRDCGILLKNHKNGSVDKIPFTEEDRTGNVYKKEISVTDTEAITYTFYEGDKVVSDANGKRFQKRPEHTLWKAEQMEACILNPAFDWGDDRHPCTEYADSLFYQLHVRGFTQDPSSKQKEAGTFLGVAGKADYLKELGVSAVVLMPAYEFIELEDQDSDNPYHAPKKDWQLNYWGFKEGYYYAPKASYSYGEDCVFEFKTMVKTLHEKGLEVIMQFYFPARFSGLREADILKYWLDEYHVDGFYLCGEGASFELIAACPYFADTKLLGAYWNEDAIYEYNEKPARKNLGCIRDDYMLTMRRFLKGDEGMLWDALSKMRECPRKTAMINYFGTYNTFTLMDCVSYDRKYNEANGENNKDGTDYNCSWNCGEEGETRKKKVLSLRKKMIKNAYLFLAFSTGTPMIFMGDEFGNSQRGNNNPYCQDNEISYLNWKDRERNKDLYTAFREIMSLRFSHPVLHPADAYRVMDYLATGCPDLSYHGESAWKLGNDYYLRSVGILYSGSYATKARGEADDTFYFAMNMYWEPQKLSVLKLPKYKHFEIVYQSSTEEVILEEDSMLVPPRSICVLKSVAEPEKKSKKRGEAFVTAHTDRQSF